MRLNQSSRIWTIASGLAAIAAIALGFGLQAYFAGRENNVPASNGCELFFARENLCAAVRWIPDEGPTPYNETRKASRFALVFRRAVVAGEPREPADPPGDVIVSLWMPGMGHGSEKTLVNHQSSTGEFLVDHVIFSMKGEWEIWVTLLKDGNFIEKSKLNLAL